MSTDGETKFQPGLEGLKGSETVRDHVVCALLGVNQQRKITGFSGKAAAFLLPAEQILHQSTAVLPEQLREAIEETFRDGASVQDRDLNFLRANGSESPVSVNTMALFAPDGSVSSVVMMLTDLAPIGDLEEHLRRLDCLASIGTLSAGMAHEIKNALVAVRTFLDLLIQQNKDAELTGIVSREVRRIDSIVSQMLRFAGPAKPTFSALLMRDVLEQSCRLIEHQLAKKQIHLQKTFLASPDLMRGDSYQLEQAFLNLLFNAIEAMGPNGELVIATDLVTPETKSPVLPASQPTHLRLRIKDNGVGIPPENIARLFDPFFTTKKRGTGLGLSITRRIIQEHGGTINVESEPDKGTTFTILLPRAGKL